MSGNTSAPPKHVAIIMDGNGRWAQRKGRQRFYGHVRGVARVKEIVQAASDMGIQALTLYAFSTENWGRPIAEIEILWRLLERYLKKEVESLYRNNVKLHVIGELERLPSHLQTMVRASVSRLAENSGLQLTIAISYGSRKEIADSARRFAADCISKRASLDEFTEEVFESYLWTSFLGHLQPVDLVIRTSGEYRVSNFLLWQSAYAEYYFTDTCWPDFGRSSLEKAIQTFASRERRFGGTETQWQSLRTVQTPRQPPQELLQA